MKLEKATMIMQNKMPSCGDKLTFTSEERYEAYQLTIEVLKKQTPKKLIEMNGVDFRDWICPSCGEQYDIKHDKFKFCPNCGQAIDWSEEK